MAARKLRSAAVVAALITGLLVSGRPLIAHAANFVVNSTVDAPDAHPGDGVCADPNGNCTLRAAIDETNALGGTNQVNLPPATYTLSNTGFDISSSNLTITGGGAGSTIVNGANSTAVGVPITVAPVGGLHISGVTIENGAGGGISNGGTLTVDSSTFSGNVAGVEGGAIANDVATATITNSRFFNNSVSANNGVGGGAISNRAGALTITSSVIDHNVSAGYGGGIAADGNTTIINTTITANTSNSNGGGGISTGTAPTIVLSSTIDANTSANYGGGIESYVGTSPTVQIKNTIISGNTAGVNGANCFGAAAIASQGHNIDSGTTCGFAAAGDLANTDPVLGPLLANGGPTETQAISPGSPAIDAGSPDCPPPQTDQRGSPRPIGRGCDVGAFEYLPPVSFVLPAVMNAAYGGYTTTAYVQNLGSVTAGVTILYYDQAGNAIGSGDHNFNLAPHATWTVSQSNGNSLASTQAGSALIYSTQPIASFVNESAPGGADGSAYNAIPWRPGPTTLFAPAIAKQAYGGYTTGIGLVNLSPLTLDITVTYRDAAGNVVGGQTLGNTPGGAYRGLYTGDPALGLPPGFAGTATIQSAGPLAAIVNETGPGGQFSSYDASSGSVPTLYAPVALNNAYAGYYTGMAIQNTTNLMGSVSVTYYDISGAATTKNFTISAYGYLGVYQGSATDGPPQGAYTAKITSTTGIAAIVNETAPSTGVAKQSTAYNTFASGAAASNLTLVESAGSDGWSTGEGIMNTGSAATTVTVSYHDAATGASVGTPQSQLLQPNAFWGVYQPTGGLPNGTRASAVVTTTGQPVAVVCNESSPTTFMSYTGQ